MCGKPENVKYKRIAKISLLSLGKCDEKLTGVQESKGMFFWQQAADYFHGTRFTIISKSMNTMGFVQIRKLPNNFESHKQIFNLFDEKPTVSDDLGKPCFPQVSP